MRAVVQRVGCASVEVEGCLVASIDNGLLILIGVARGDTTSAAHQLSQKLAGLRLFPDAAGKMNLSVLDAGGEVLVVPQFTLVSDISRGRRPSFGEAAEPREAERLVGFLVQELRSHGLGVKTGQFGAHMQVTLRNDGPVTFVIDA